MIAVRYDKYGNEILTASFDGSVGIWDLRTNKYHTTALKNMSFSEIHYRLTGKLTGHSLEITNALFNVDYTQVITGSLDTTAKIWDVRNLRCVHTFYGHSDEVIGWFSFC